MMEFKFDAASGEVVGYASAWGNPPDQVGDVVMRGAFRDSLSRGLPLMLREHKGEPVGAWQEAVEDDLGLRVRGVVTDQATLDDLRAGRLDGLSIGFAAMKTSRTGRVRNLEQVELHEVSFGRRPVNSRARVLSVKSEENMDVETKDVADQPAADELLTKVETISGELGKLAARLAKLEVKANRPGAAAAEPKGDAERKAFTAYVRKGIEKMDALETKDLVVSSDTAGGYLAPDQFVAELLRNIVLFSPVRSVARVTTIGAPAAILPRRTGRLTASWVGETQARPETQPSYGQLRFEVRELSCYVDVSMAALEDSAFDVASELAFDFAEEFGRAEGAAFVNGSGNLQPFGFLTDSGIANTVSGHASQITADGLIQLFHDLPAPYRTMGTWGMNASTLGTIRKLKDGSTGTYLLMTSGIANAPATTLLGRPVIELPDMPDIGAGTFPVVFGDFGAGYRIFDRLQLAVLRDGYTQAGNGLVRFIARRRVAAGVTKTEALRKLKISA